MGSTGPVADSREGAAGCVVDGYFYIHGGFSRELFGNMRVYDLEN
jgi:hypothetical protein